MLFARTKELNFSFFVQSSSWDVLKNSLEFLWTSQDNFCRFLKINFHGFRDIFPWNCRNMLIFWTGTRYYDKNQCFGIRIGSTGVDFPRKLMLVEKHSAFFKVRTAKIEFGRKVKFIRGVVFSHRRLARITFESDQSRPQFFPFLWSNWGQNCSIFMSINFPKK